MMPGARSGQRERPACSASVTRSPAMSGRPRRRRVAWGLAAGAGTDLADVLTPFAAGLASSIAAPLQRLRFAWIGGSWRARRTLRTASSTARASELRSAGRCDAGQLSKRKDGQSWPQGRTGPVQR